VSMYPKNPVSREYVVNCTASQTKSQVLIATAVVGKTASAGNQWEFKVHPCLSRMCVRSVVINKFSGAMWVQHPLFLGAFANLRKTTISIFLSYCMFVRMEQLCSHWRDFHEIWYLNIFRRYS